MLFHARDSDTKGKGRSRRNPAFRPKLSRIDYKRNYAPKRRGGEAIFPAIFAVRFAMLKLDTFRGETRRRQVQRWERKVLTGGSCRFWICWQLPIRQNASRMMPPTTHMAGSSFFFGRAVGSGRGA
jgi:hypothetical protein